MCLKLLKIAIVMRRCFFSICLLLLSISASYSQEVSCDDNEISKFQTTLNKLIPQYIKVQFAGSIGVVSVGSGWIYGQDRWESDIILGVVPKTKYNSTMPVLTLKQSYIPWHLPIKSSSFEVSPLVCGMFINSIMNDSFWIAEPSRYGEGYYNFSTQIRFNIHIGQRITYHIKREKYRLKSYSFFYELSTCDMYLISAITNSYLKPKDYLSLALGLKFNFL